MATRIKVSGVTHPDDARLASELGVDLVACVFYARSPRYVTMSTAWAVRQAVASSVQTVGIFVDTPVPLVQQVVTHCGLDHAQLFGREPRGDVDAVRPHAFKALSVAQPASVEALARPYLGLRVGRLAAPALLLNLTRSARSTWQAAQSVAARAPILLASSAIGPATMHEAIRVVRPWGIDVWESVEAEPGRLDPRRLESLITAVRAADLAMVGT